MTNKIELEELGQIQDIHGGEVVPTSITSEMKKSYLDYAMSVIVARALPDIRDGLKPVQRRIIYAANEVGLQYNQRYRKAATLVGEVMGKYHPHGDSSIYDALVRMAQDFSLRYPLIDGQGNWGNIDGDPAAAMRYTECKLEKISDYLLKDIEKETVKFEDNFSGEHKEPLILPSIIPNLMMNGAVGIAVGMATNIPPHNLNELADAINMFLEQSTISKLELIHKEQRIYDVIDLPIDIQDWQANSNVTVEQLYKIVRGPDFPTGCTIYDKTEIIRYLATGQGRIIQQAKAEIRETKKERFQIVVTEIPYMVNKSTLIEKIAQLVNDKKIKDISEIKDTSSGEDIEIIIELKKDAKPQKVLNYLYKYSPLQTAFNANMLAIVDGHPENFGIVTYIDEYVKHRKIIITNRTIYLLRKSREREHILQGLKKALDFIDEVVEIIKKSKDTNTAKEKLMARFELTEIQAVAILDMQLKRLAALEREKIEDELKEIEKNIKKYLAILINPKQMIEVIKTELLEVKEAFGDKRKTKVVAGKIGEFSEEDVIAEEETLIAITETGYIKRVKPSTYKTQSRGGKGIMGMKTKAEDEVLMLRSASTHDRILFFTNRGKVYEKRVWDIEESSRTSKGTAIINILDIEQNEKVEEMITIGKDYESRLDSTIVILATSDGSIKKTKLSEFQNIRRTGIIAIGLDEGASLIGAKLSDGSCEVLLVTAKGKSIRFKEEDVREMGRSAGGVRGIKIKSDDKVVSMEVVPSDSTSRLLCIMSKGYGKSTPIQEYTLQNRGGSGMKAAKVTPKTGDIISVKLLDDKISDLLITSQSGQVIRLNARSIPTSSRDTQGVILMRLNSGDSISAVSAIREEEANAEEELAEGIPASS